MTPRFLSSDLFLVAQTDERLSALASDGHGRAFAVLVDRHRRPLLGHARRMVGPDRAEDVLQQALLRAWRSLQAGAEIRSIPAWLHRIVHNASLNEIERQIETSDPLDENLADARSVATIAEQHFEVAEVLQSLANLPQRQRLALLGTEIEGRSRRQLAAELGLSEGAVRQLVHRARTQVRTAVAAVVPFPLVYRAMRNAGWVHTAAQGAPLRSAAEAAGASGALTGGVVKVVSVVVAIGAAGAVGERVLVRSTPARGHVVPAIIHHPGTASRSHAAGVVSLRDVAAAVPASPSGVHSATPRRPASTAVASAAPSGVAAPRREPPGAGSMSTNSDSVSGTDGEARPSGSAGRDGGQGAESDPVASTASDRSAQTDPAGTSRPAGSGESTDTSTADSTGAPVSSMTTTSSPDSVAAPTAPANPTSDLTSSSGD